MKAPYVHDYHHEEHREWMMNLDFYQDEIAIFQKELTTVMLSSTALYSFIEHVDEYRKILKVKLGKIDDMRYQIALHEHNLSANNIAKLEDDVWAHHQLRETISTFIQTMEELKSGLKHFLAGHLKNQH